MLEAGTVPDGLVIKEGRRLLYGTQEKGIRRFLHVRGEESTNDLLKMDPNTHNL